MGGRRAGSGIEHMEHLEFLRPQQVRDIQAIFGTPVFVYSRTQLEEQARLALTMPHAFDFTARYAMKACPTAMVLHVLNRAGMEIDASSGYECERAMRAGILPTHIQLTAQELPRNLKALVERGVGFTACSLNQLRIYGEHCRGYEITVRINPGLGSGHSNRTNVGGPSASFGIWREYLDEVLEIVKQYELKLTGMHTHIGSGADPEVWNHVAKMNLDVAERLPTVTSLSLGGGFKIARMPGEIPANLHKIGEVIKADFKDFAKRTGRELKLEIEPGTFMVANAGALIATVSDIVDTGAEGRKFIKVDSGMTEILRPSLYGAQHPVTLVPHTGGIEERDKGEYIIAGHCCESGDILTPEPGNPEGLLPRELPEPRLGDAIVVGGAGAYCSSMAAKNYNSFPEAAEVMVMNDGTPHLIRHRQTLDQMIGNEETPQDILN